MKVYFSTLFNELAEGELVESGSCFLNIIRLESGREVTMPCSRPLYQTAEERTIDIFLKEIKRMSVDDILLKYNMNKTEAKIALDKAIDLFPDKFI